MEGEVTATHSASGVASFRSLALSAADRFKSPPEAREGEIKRPVSLKSDRVKE